MTKKDAALHLRMLRLLGMAALIEKPGEDIVWVAFSRQNVKALEMAIAALEEQAEERGKEHG